MARDIEGKRAGSANPLSSKSLISIKDLNRAKIELILKEAESMYDVFHKGRKLDILSGKTMATLFYEPSTRTKLTFQRAMIALGGHGIGDPSMDNSSVAKGESLVDTVKVVSSFSDIIVFRHYEKGTADIAAKVSDVPVINAGDGAGEHPTQALLDLFTIKKEKKRIEGLKIAIVGDLKSARTIHSLAYTLGMFDNELVFISPRELGLPKEIRDELKSKGSRAEFAESLDHALDADVVYMPRIQRERFVNPRAYQKFLGLYKIDRNFLKRANSDTIIMSPGPRLEEISTDIDGMKNSVYLKQGTYGVPIRMAILNMILGSRLLSNS